MLQGGGRSLEGVRVLRADTAAYRAAILNECEATGKRFAIGADLDAAMKAQIAQIPETASVKWRDAEIAETVPCMNKTQKAFRLIVVRRPQQGDLFDKGVPRYR
jgi:hypothetical protein